MYSREGVDRKIITNIVGTDNQAHNAFNAEYMSYVLHVNYRFAPKWNLFAKGMYETASVYKASDEVEKGKYRTAWGYAGGIEFYPMESNLHFFLAYVGRSYKYTDRAKALGEDNFSTIVCQWDSFGRCLYSSSCFPFLFVMKNRQATCCCCYLS